MYMYVFMPANDTSLTELAPVSTNMHRHSVPDAAPPTRLHHYYQTRRSAW